MPKVCSRCGREKLYQSKPKSAMETMAAWILLRPFRCTNCNIRKMGFAWWWEPRPYSRHGRSKQRSASELQTFRAVPVEEVRSAIKQSEEKQRETSPQRNK